MFEVKTIFTTENVKKAKAQFLIDAVTFGDAETQAFAQHGTNQNVVVMGVTRSKINDFLRVGDGAKWFKVFYQYELDTESGKTKTYKEILLVDADNVSEAHDRAADHLGKDYKITKIEESAIVDVILHDQQTNEFKPLPKREKVEFAPIGKKIESQFNTHGTYGVHDELNE